MGGFDYLSFNELRHASLAVPFDFEEEVELANLAPDEDFCYLINSRVRCDRIGSNSALSLSVVGADNIPSPWISLKSIHQQCHSLLSVARDSHQKIGLLILTDSANAFSAVHAGNPRTTDILTRLHLCYIRDGLDLYNLPFIAAGFNIGDAGARKLGAVHLVGKISQTNTCRVGFLTRDEMETIATRALLRADPVMT